VIPLLKQCRDDLRDAVILLNAAKRQFAPTTTNSEADVFLSRIAYRMEKYDNELDRTDGPSEQQVDAALEAYNGAPGQMTEVTAGGMRRAMKRALYVAGVRAPRGTVLPARRDLDDKMSAFYSMRDSEWMKALLDAGCVIVTKDGEEIK
jgi:hypothetical protein